MTLDETFQWSEFDDQMQDKEYAIQIREIGHLDN